MLDNLSNNVWIVDNNMYRNGDDSLQTIDRASRVPFNHRVANGIYVGRNVMHHDVENAIDIKGTTNTIITQNTIYGYKTLADSSAGEAIRINDEGHQDNIWIIYNRIFDSVDGIDPMKALSRPYIIGNLIHDITGNAINSDARVVTNNTIYNCIYTGAKTSWGDEASGIAINRSRGYAWEVTNNIISDCRTPFEYCSNCGARHFRANNLIYNHVTSAPCTNDSCIFDLDPQFVNATDPVLGQRDFRLLESSPAVNAGGEISYAYQLFFDTYGIDIRVDADGNPRPAGTGLDIGAFEMQ